MGSKLLFLILTILIIGKGFAQIPKPPFDRSKLIFFNNTYDQLQLNSVHLFTANLKLDESNMISIAKQDQCELEKFYDKVITDDQKYKEIISDMHCYAGLNLNFNFKKLSSSQKESMAAYAFYTSEASIKLFLDRDKAGLNNKFSPLISGFDNKAVELIEQAEAAFRNRNYEKMNC